jgi:hypothetical protein
MRITLHAVAEADHGPFRAAMLPSLRAAALNDRRFRDTGLTVEQADELFAVVVAAATDPSTRTELEQIVARHLGRTPAPGLWRAIRLAAPLVHAPSGSPWSFGSRPSYVATAVDDRDHAGGVRHLVRRYLAAFGPASVADICRFTLLRRRPVRAALDELADELVEHETEEGGTVLDLADLELPDPDRPAPPRLLGMWDSLLLAHDDRGRILPDEVRAHAIRRNGDVLPTVLLDGLVAGVWRATAAGIEVTPLSSITTRAWEAIAEEATRLRAFLAPREPLVHAGLGRWWDQLPDAGRRLVT